MWIFTRYGFFSVATDGKGGGITIRAQVKSDLDRLGKYALPNLSEPISHVGENFLWYATTTQEDWSQAMKILAHDVQYKNFPQEVALCLGESRAQRIRQVWAPLADMQGDLPEEGLSGPLDGLPLNWKLSSAKKAAHKVAYGAVLISPTGHLLLREVKNHFDGYSWTFPKGRPILGEAPRQTAIRTVLQKTGVNARILTPILGEFVGGTTLNRYFLMTVDKKSVALDFSSDETAGLCWVLPREAREFIAQTRNALGLKRDLAVLEAALACLPSDPPLLRPIATRYDNFFLLSALPAARKKLVVDLVYSNQQMARIIRGFIPHSSDDKWIIYYEDGSLYLHRSWTGLCLYRVDFAPVDNGWAMTAVWINDHPAQRHSFEGDEFKFLLEMIDIHLMAGTRVAATE